MNVFILNTGRCGSTTFIKACKHISNYTSAHESLINRIGKDRFAYPLNHIEADNRLAWFTGKLDLKYGNDAFYIHLSRDIKKTIASFSKRENYGIMKAYKEGILLGGEHNQTITNIAEDYIGTVEENIRFFLKNKSHKMNFSLETPDTDFRTFWQKISAKGDMDAALNEFTIHHNAS